MTFPDFINDSDFKNLVMSMLNKINGSRYCKFDQISSHPWFKRFNWNDLISLDMKPSYFPKIENKNSNDNDIRSYLDYVNSLEEWTPNEKVTISAEDERYFSDWFKKF